MEFAGRDLTCGVESLTLADTSSSNGHVVLPSSSTLDPDPGAAEDFEIRSEASEASSSRSAPKSARSGSGVGGNFTKVCYHIDDESMPYVTEVPVSPDKITLLDFKGVLNKTNYKFYCKSNDPEVGEVKAEIRDDNQQLFRSSNGHFELFLLTADGSDGASSGFSRNARQPVPGPAPSSYPFGLPQHLRNFGTFDHGHRRRHFEDSTVVTESDARVFSDDESRVSTSTDNITSVSRQHNNYRVRQRRIRRHLRQPSRASSMSSMTETSMSLEVMTVTLNMDSVNFLGISIVGQSSTGGDNGIYVANVMKGGAVALDGRIEPGDMILQVNERSFENLTNDEAVEVLKEAVSRRGPIKLTVAKSWDPAAAGNGRPDLFSVPSREPVRPIDMRAWIQHTNAANNLPHIPEGSEGAPTPVPGQYQFGRAQSSSTATSNGSGQQTVIGPNGQLYVLPRKLDVTTDRKRVVYAMAMPKSGLDIKDRTWLKIPIPMSFLGSDLVDWLVEHVSGVHDRKSGKKYATELLREGLITHMVNGDKFSEQSYYMIGHPCSDVLCLRMEENNPNLHSGAGMVLPPAPQHINGLQQQPQQQPPASQHWTTNNAMTGDYMPISPFPQQRDIFSQVSGESSGSERRRPVILPPPPSSSGVYYVPYNQGSAFLRQQMRPNNCGNGNGGGGDYATRASSRQSFRIACGNQTSEEYFIDHL